MPDIPDSLLKKLEVGLNLAAQNRRSAGEPSRPMAMASLYYLLRFLREGGIARSSLQPLEDLLAALDDAEAGRHNKLLLPSPYDPKQPREPVRESVRFAEAAACVSLLVEDGLTRAAAINQVADALGIHARELSTKYAEMRKTRRPSGAVTGAAVSRRPHENEIHLRMKEIRNGRPDLTTAEFVSRFLLSIRAGI